MCYVSLLKLSETKWLFISAAWRLQLLSEYKLYETVENKFIHKNNSLFEYTFGTMSICELFKKGYINCDKQKQFKNFQNSFRFRGKMSIISMNVLLPD